jgi:hypothetical protein
MTNALWRQAMSTTEKDKSLPLLSVGGHFNKGDIQVRTSLNVLIVRLDHRSAPIESIAMSKQGLTVMFCKCHST